MNIISIIVSFFLFSNTFGDVIVENCNDMINAFFISRFQDVMVQITSTIIKCEPHTLFTLNSGNKLTITSSSDEIDELVFENVGIEISGSEIVIEVNVLFLESKNALYVDIDSSAIFLRDLKFRNARFEFESKEDDYELLNTIYNRGYLIVDGSSEFFRSYGIFNDESGFISMKSVDIIEQAVTGIYNLGKILINGNSKFVSIYYGGGIFNEGSISFIKGSNVLFNRCIGCILTRGHLEFSGPVVFIESSSSYEGTIVIQSGYMKLSKNSYFFNNISGGEFSEIIFVNRRSQLDYHPESTYFIGSSSRKPEEIIEFCPGVYFEESGCQNVQVTI